MKYTLVGYDENKKPVDVETTLSPLSGIECKRQIEHRAKEWMENGLYPLIRIIKEDEDTGETLAFTEWWHDESGWHHQYCEIHDVDE